MGNESQTVTGPITGGRRGIPFCRPTTDIAARNYVCEEFFLEGEAVSYVAAPGSGAWSGRQVGLR